MEFEEPQTGLAKNDYFGYWYLQYWYGMKGTQLYNTSLNLSGLSLITGLYMLEPWERKMFNIFLIGLLTVSCTTIYTIKHIFF